MGDRGQIHIADSGVYLYTHYGASDLPATLARALDRGRSRWGDPDYLTRIIFSEMVRGDVDGKTGYGIGTEEYGDAWRVLMVSCEAKRVRFEKGRGFHEDEHGGKTYSFEGFVDAF